jgi:hypothetical protein
VTYPVWASSNAEQSLPRCEHTDIPRLMCGCPEHAAWNAEFDFDDLEPSEHAMFANEPEPETPVRSATPVALPEYQAEPWCETRNVPLVTTGSVCGVCGRRLVTRSCAPNAWTTCASISATSPACLTTLT